MKSAVLLRTKILVYYSLIWQLSSLNRASWFQKFGLCSDRRELPINLPK